jgi:hypothetical protein
MGFLAAETKSTVDKGKTENFQLGNSKYGIPIPEGFGTVKLPGNVIWATDVEEEKTSTTATSGGKGLGPTQKTTTVTWNYYANFAVSFGKGPAARILRLWADTKIIYDVYGGGDGTEQVTFRFYDGDENQLPDPLIESNIGIGATPAFRGQTYIVFERLHLENFGNRIPTITAEIVYEGVTGSTGSSGSANDGILNEAGEVAPTSLRTDMMVADWSRNVIWTQSDSSDTIYGYSPSTLQIVRSIDPEPVGFKLGGVNSRTGSLLGYTNTNGYVISAVSGDISAQTSDSRFRGEMSHAYEIKDGDVKEYYACVNRELSPPFCNILTSELNHYADFGLGGVTSNITNPVNGAAGVIWFAETRGTDNFFKFQKCSIASDGGIAIKERENFNGTFFGTSQSVGFDTHLHHHGPSNTLIVTDRLYPSGDFLVFRWVEKPLPDSILWSTIIPSADFEGNQPLMNTTCQFGYNTRLDGSVLAIGGPGSTVAIINILDGKVTYKTDTPVPPEPSISSFASFYDGRTSSIYHLQAGQGIHRARLGSPPLRTTAAKLIASLLLKAGLEGAGDVDVSELEDLPIDGFLLDGTDTISQYLQPLLDIFRFDLIESDYKIKVRSRGGALNAIVYEESFQEKKDLDNYQETRVQESEIPFEIEVTALDRESVYEPNTQRSRRPKNPVSAVYSDNKESFETTAVIPVDGAAKQAHVLLRTGWLERSSYDFTLSHKYLWLDVGDRIQLRLDNGLIVRCRIEKMEINTDWTIDVRVRGESDGQFTSERTGKPTLIKPVKPKPIIPSEFFPLDLPFIRDTDALTRIYHTQYLAGGVYEDVTNWNGMGVYDFATDPYKFVATVAAESAWGTTRSTIGAPVKDLFMTDTVNFIDLQVVQGVDLFETRTMQEVLNGANWLAVRSSFNFSTGAEPGFEIIGFQNVQTIGKNRVRLTNLLRGLRGTDPFVAEHLKGKEVVLLDSARLVTHRVPLTVTEIDYGWASFGGLVENSRREISDINRRSLRPYAPGNIKAVESGGNINLTWVRRTRYNGELLDLVEVVPLNEDTESYDVVIEGGTNTGGSVTFSSPRIITGIPVPSMVYSNSDIISDFGSIPLNIRLRVYQNSTQVGRGFEKTTIVRVD